MFKITALANGRWAVSFNGQDLGGEFVSRRRAEAEAIGKWGRHPVQVFL